MRRLLYSVVLALTIAVLAASVTMAAPRVAPDATSVDLGVSLNWASAGVVADLNMPMGDLGLRVVGEVYGSWWGWFELGVSAAIVYPVVIEQDFKLGITAGAHVGFEGGSYYTYSSAVYVGVIVGVVAEVPIEKGFSLYGEVIYAPAVAFYNGGTWFTWWLGGYGIYGTYELPSGTTLNAGIRSIGFVPGFLIGITF